MASICEMNANASDTSTGLINVPQVASHYGQASAPNTEPTIPATHIPQHSHSPSLSFLGPPNTNSNSPNPTSTPSSLHTLPHGPPPPYSPNPDTTPAPSPPLEPFDIDSEAQRTASTRSSIYSHLSDTHKRFRHSITVGSAIITLAIFSLELWSHIDELAES